MSNTLFTFNSRFRFIFIYKHKDIFILAFPYLFYFAYNLSKRDMTGELDVHDAVEYTLREFLFVLCFNKCLRYGYTLKMRSLWNELDDNKLLHCHYTKMEVGINGKKYQVVHYGGINNSLSLVLSTNRIPTRHFITLIPYYVEGDEMVEDDINYHLMRTACLDRFCKGTIYDIDCPNVKSKQKVTLYVSFKDEIDEKILKKFYEKFSYYDKV